MKIRVNASKNYNIYLKHNLLNNLEDYIKDDCRKLIISDDIVDKLYVEKVVKQLTNVDVYIVEHGEKAKSFTSYEKIISFMLERSYCRKDMVIALGGGVVGDLAGFVAATYKRGIKFINIPTTTLSQIDSSIGGKVGINVGKIKNCVGAFYQPDMVLIDYDVLNTLDKRQYNSGLVEALKAGLIYDQSLFSLFEEEKLNLEKIIYKALMVKKDIVEKDEMEQGLRKILNFGHTIGHGYESYFDLDTYYHGECVAFGMLKVIDNKDILERVERILKRMDIVCPILEDKSLVYNYIVNDKKIIGDKIDLVKIDCIGHAYIDRVLIEDIKAYI